MSDLRHIHDPVLSSLKMEGISLPFLNPHCYWVRKQTWQPSCAIKIPVGKGKGKVHPRKSHEGPDGE
jgi:hypothetical protein